MCNTNVNACVCVNVYVRACACVYLQSCDPRCGKRRHVSVRHRDGAPGGTAGEAVDLYTVSRYTHGVRTKGPEGETIIIIVVV